MHTIGHKELDAVRRVFRRGKLFRCQREGRGECDRFEREFARKTGARHAILVTSGTNALIAALSACGIGPGDEVIVPAYTFVATAIAVTSVGATPVIANIDETLGISPEEIEKRITPRTRAIIPVHMDGLSADMARIMRIARRHRLRVIEDAAQAIGGSHGGRRLGSWGDAGCFSLNENKSISCGEGGIVTVSRRELYERAYCMQDASAQFGPLRESVFRRTQPFLGGSMRVSEITGAIARVQLGRLDGILKKLRARKRLFVNALEEQTVVRVVTGSCAKGDCGTSLHLLFEDPGQAARIGRELRKQGLPFVPTTARPAHACWKWTGLYSYPAARYLGSVEILTRTLKMDLALKSHSGSAEAWRLVKLLKRS